jgi:hypothetical protein
LTRARKVAAVRSISNWAVNKANAPAGTSFGRVRSRHRPNTAASNAAGSDPTLRGQARGQPHLAEEVAGFSDRADLLGKSPRHVPEAVVGLVEVARGNQLFCAEKILWRTGRST